MGFLRQFFHGRNGSDQLNIALLVASLLILFLGRLIDLSFLRVISQVLLFLCIFRMLSRNVTRRQQENALFLEKTARFRRNKTHRGTAGATRQARVKKDKANYRYFKCPNCKQNLRAPRGKGKLKITCSKCGTVFHQST